MEDLDDEDIRLISQPLRLDVNNKVGKKYSAVLQLDGTGIIRQL